MLRGCQTTRGLGRCLGVFGGSARRVSVFAGKIRVPEFSHSQLPQIENEPMNDYAPGCPKRQQLLDQVEALKARAPQHIKPVINGKEVSTGNVGTQICPSEHSRTVCTFENAGAEQVQEAIAGALEAKKTWSTMPIAERQGVFLRAAELISKKYRYEVMAATILGQGKNIWQAEIDAAAETADFLRYNVKFSQEIYRQQPSGHTDGVWNRLEYRPLEGFVYAVSPFNFTAIGCNLATAPALMGNTVVWKPAPAATLSSWIVYKALREAGLPDGVIQFVPGDAEVVTETVLASPDFSALHFTGSTHVFRSLWQRIAAQLPRYRSYPRIVGETGGKNFHLVHESADIDNAVQQTVRAAFEYQGQKCSACSRVFVPDSRWAEFKAKLCAALQAVVVGDPASPATFVGPVIGAAAFDRIVGAIEHMRAQPGCSVVAGGTYDRAAGFFVAPTVLQTDDPAAASLVDEIFGPVLTAFVYPAADFDAAISLADSSAYALTGAVFAADREALLYAATRLTNAAGNLYLNDKCTGAVVGQQAFGGARASGTNDKGGSPALLQRFVSPRTIKETFLPLKDFRYPHNAV